MEVQPEEWACKQCGRGYPPSAFVGKRGQSVGICKTCRALYKPGNYGIRGSVPRRLLRVLAPDGVTRVTWIPKSGNKKLGGIPESIVSPETCPPSCGFYGKGCYAEFGASGHHWRNVEHHGLAWDDFIARVRALPAGQLWRYAVAGDLPGDGEEIDQAKLAQLVDANRGKRGFAFTHKRAAYEAIRDANLAGFTVNLSTDTLEGADAAWGSGLPVAVVLPADASGDIRTPAGRRVVICPAQLREDVTCASCQLCSISQRKGIVGFRAHGQMKKTVTKISLGETP
ncbi:MAG TPA: hypothetical protein VK571_06935 [Gemmatimonadaceae bacterium]|nr:hypothetical protein [Gemmatimonadaceae bacterium]